jgi:ribosomal protein L35
LRRDQAFRGHNFEIKSSARTRRLGRVADVSKSDEKAVRRMLGI